jgi:hypothetical protein
MWIGKHVSVECQVHLNCKRAALLVVQGNVSNLLSLTEVAISEEGILGGL